jgi:hypothetical protein
MHACSSWEGQVAVTSGWQGQAMVKGDAGGMADKLGGLPGKNYTPVETPEPRQHPLC